jgi:hypothetical protein
VGTYGLSSLGSGRLLLSGGGFSLGLCARDVRSAGEQEERKGEGREGDRVVSATMHERRRG